MLIKEVQTEVQMWITQNVGTYSIKVNLNGND